MKPQFQFGLGSIFVVTAFTSLLLLAGRGDEKLAVLVMYTATILGLGYATLRRRLR